MYPPLAQLYASGTQIDAYASPPYAPSSPLTEPSTPTPPPQQRPATPHHLSESIVIDSDDDGFSFTETIADSPPPQLVGPSTSPPANFGFTQLRRALESHAHNSARDKDTAYSMSATDMGHPQDRNPALQRHDSLPAAQTPIETILFLSLHPGAYHERHALRFLANTFRAAHPEYEIIDLYGHLARWIQHEDRALAKWAIAPVDYHACERALKEGTGVQGLVGGRVLERLVRSMVKEGARKFVVLGFAFHDRFGVEAWCSEVSVPKMMVACVYGATLTDETQHARLKQIYGKDIIMIPFVSETAKSIAALNAAIVGRAWDGTAAEHGEIIERKWRRGIVSLNPPGL